MEDPRFPLLNQILCIVLTALLIWAFAIAREPRQWRRLFQATFSRADRFSINRNKVLDEKITRYTIVVAAVILLLDATVFVFGMTHHARMRGKAVPIEQWRQSSAAKSLQDEALKP